MAVRPCCDVTAPCGWSTVTCADRRHSYTQHTVRQGAWAHRAHRAHDHMAVRPCCDVTAPCGWSTVTCADRRHSYTQHTVRQGAWAHRAHRARSAWRTPPNSIRIASFGKARGHTAHTERGQLGERPRLGECAAGLHLGVGDPRDRLRCGRFDHREEIPAVHVGGAFESSGDRTGEHHGAGDAGAAQLVGERHTL